MSFSKEANTVRGNGLSPGRSVCTPLGNGGTAQSVALSQGTGLFFRPLELCSNSRRSADAAIKYYCINTFFPLLTK